MKLKDIIAKLRKTIDERVARIKELTAKIEDPELDGEGNPVLLTQEEEAELDGLMASLEKDKTELARLEKINSSLAPFGASDPAPRSDPSSIRQMAGGGYHSQRPQFVIPSNVRRVTPRNFRNFDGEEHGPQVRAFRFGMWAMHVLANQLPNKYGHLMKATESFYRDNFQNVSSGGGSGGDGGHFTVPEEFSSDLIDLKERRGVVRQTFGRETMMSDVKRVPRRLSGLTAHWVGENAAGTESTMEFDDVKLVAEKLMVLTRMSKEIDEDNAIDLGDKIAGEISYAMASAEDSAGLNGTGLSTDGGIVGAIERLTNIDGAGTNSAGLLSGSGNAWSALVLADFSKVVGGLPDYADNDNTVWITHRTFYYEVMERLLLASGGVTGREVRDSVRGATGVPLFLGYPVIFSQVMSSATAASTTFALLGDFVQAAKFGDRRSETIEFDDTVTVGGQSVWERDQIAVKGTERVDINVHEFGDASNKGSYVGLQTTA